MSSRPVHKPKAKPTRTVRSRSRTRSAAPPRRTRAASSAPSPAPQAAVALRRRALFLMHLARAWDTRFEMLLRTGRLGKWYSSVGNEAATVAAGLCLWPGDPLLTLHRDVGAIFAVYLDLERLAPDLLPRLPGQADAPDRREDPRRYLYRLACQMLGRADGFSQGIERSYHYGHIDEAAGICHVGMISHLGAMVPVAAGMGLHGVLERARGERPEGAPLPVALNFIGDGATSEGDVHEALNLAAVWKLPLVLVVENNRYAFSTPTREQYACQRLSDRAIGYGIAGETVDGSDFDTVHAALERAVGRARRGDGPTLLEVMLGRLRGHAEGDGSYDLVPEAERAAYQAADPVPAFGRKLVGEGVIDEAHLAAVKARCRELIDEAVDAAMAAAEPAPEVAHRPVFASPGPTPASEPPRAVAGEPVTYLEAIRRAQEEEMTRDPRVVLLGQDIAAFGGAFRATQGLFERFGAWRVLNTPIVESGAIGVALGAALLGDRPVVEMQFADFVTCAFNQLVNNVAKTFYRWQRPVPLVVRLPAGGGAGAGAFHSQSMEAWFVHCPGLKIVYPSTAADAYGLLKAAIRDPDPVLFFEHKYLYRREKEPLPAGDPLVPIGRGRLLREGRDLTLLSYGWMARESLAAAEVLAQEGIDTEVVDLRTLVPLDEELVLASVRRTGKALVVHEAGLLGGFGGELAALIADRAFEHLDGPVRRLGVPDRPSPYNKKLEAELLPDREKIARAARALAAY